LSSVDLLMWAGQVQLNSAYNHVPDPTGKAGCQQAAVIARDNEPVDSSDVHRQAPIRGGGRSSTCFTAAPGIEMKANLVSEF